MTTIVSPPPPSTRGPLGASSSQASVTAPGLPSPDPSASQVPALLVERATKRFVVDRRKSPVVAVADVSLLLPKLKRVG